MKLNLKIIMPFLASTLLAGFRTNAASGSNGSQVDLTVSIYNSAADGISGVPAIAIVRDLANDTLKLKICSEVFKATSNDPKVVGQEVLDFEPTCVAIENLQSPTFGYNVFRNYIGRNDQGQPQRVVYTAAGLANTKRDPEVLLSDVTTWTINTLAGGALMPDDLVLLVGARVTNEKIKNPQISTYRQTFVIAGSGNRLGDEIPRM